MKITIAGNTFPSQDKAADFIRGIRDSYRDGQVIQPQHHAHLLELLTYHSEHAEKIGSGVKHFTVATDPMYRTRHFDIHRIDGSVTDFSFMHCIKGRSPDRDYLDALREAIAGDIKAFRRKAFLAGPVTCPFHGTVLSPETCHVDHAPPDTFQSLVARWLATQGLSLREIEISKPTDGQIQSVMTDLDQRADWEIFHLCSANLRVVSKLANLSDIRKK